MNLEGLLQSFKGSLTTSNYDALIGLLTAEVTARLEKVVLKSTFNRVCIFYDIFYFISFNNQLNYSGGRSHT